MSTKISELTAKTAPDTTDMFVIEDVDGNLYRTTVSEVVGSEATTREAMDTAIINGVGLGVDGTYTPPLDSYYITSVDHIDAGEPATVAGALKVLDRAVALVEGKINLTEIVEISAAELLAIDKAQDIIPAQDGFLINPREVIGSYVKGTTDFTHTTNPLTMQLGASNMVATFTQAFLISGSNIEVAKIDGNHKLINNTALQLYSATAPTGGDGTLTLAINYAWASAVNIFTPVTSKTCCTLSTSGTFTNASLTSGKLVITHNFSTKNIQVVIINSAGQNEALSFSLGNTVGNNQTMQATVDVGTISGTWQYVVLADNPNV